jgi:hypothetical protein
MGWATFWVIFSQTNLVTLLTNDSIPMNKESPKRYPTHRAEFEPKATFFHEKIVY